MDWRELRAMAAMEKREAVESDSVQMAIQPATVAWWQEDLGLMEAVEG
jgi:hypothetical protein